MSVFSTNLLQLSRVESTSCLWYVEISGKGLWKAMIYRQQMTLELSDAYLPCSRTVGMAESYKKYWLITCIGNKYTHISVFSHVL